MRHSIKCFAAAAILSAGISTSALAASYLRTAHGIIATPDSGAARQVRVEAYDDGAFRVTAVGQDGFGVVPQSLMVTARPTATPTIEEVGGEVVLRIPGGSARIRLADGRVTFFDSDGKQVLAEEQRGAFQSVSFDGKPYSRITQQFNRGTDEGFFGLGQHQNRQMNYNGEDVELAQHNMDIAVPFVVSTRNYGLLWDNNGISRFGNPEPYKLVGSTPGLAVSHGGQPGWKAEYFLGDKLAASRTESAIDYQFIKDQVKWPKEAVAQKTTATSGQNTAGNAVQAQRVVWTGSLEPRQSGLFKFRLYSSSYAKVFVDGKVVVDRWRQNWNPWFHLFEVNLSAGKPVSVRVEWEPNAGYMGLLYDEPQSEPDRHSLQMTSDLAHSQDYYVVLGKDSKGVIDGYRRLTGAATMMPKWAYGFWQSRQRYNTQDEVVGVLREYRARKIPIDNIVQDWFYWPEDQWGCQCFDSKRFPDPAGMVKAVHDLNGRIMISAWPKFYPNTANAKELMAKGLLYKGNLEARERDWVGPGYENTDYDPYSPQARDIYFRQLREGLVSKGFDAWWLDATEPDIHSNLSLEQRAERMGLTAQGPGAEFFNSFPLVHAEGVANGLRAARPDERPFILTRSGFGGLQRTSSAVWSGDTAARWDNLRDQISAGVNMSMSGVPNWTHDIGGFAVEDRYTFADPKALPEWRELNLRWFQFGAFSPLFRSHGETPFREVYEIAKGDPAMYDSMVGYIRMRYRLMPYIYAVAADATLQGGAIMRPLASEFPADRKGWSIDDEFMFGPGFLVAPVTEFNARKRQVYLPAGADWYDFATGKYLKGGTAITAAAPRERMPLFVRAGTILPSGPSIEWTDEKPADPVVLHVFTGESGTFSLYEDDGKSLGYARGESSRIPLQWDQSSGVLTIGKREGSYAGMPENRRFLVVFHKPGKAVVPDFDGAGGLQVNYAGQEVSLRIP